MDRRAFLRLTSASLMAGRARAASPTPVVATFSILADLTKSLGGDRIGVTSLVGPDGDVHVYEPRPADLRAVARAQVLVENGLGLEGWMGRLAQSSRFAGVRVIASTGVVPRSFIEDGTRTVDPHAWQDPRNAIIYVGNIAAGLRRVMPEDADFVGANAKTLIAGIAAADAEIEAMFARIPAEQRRIITSHDAFGYFAARYGIEMHGIQGISTEGEPSAKSIAALVALVRRERIKAVFVENMTDPRSAAMLAREAGATLGPEVYSDALSGPGGPAAHYVPMLLHNARAFARAMAAN